MIVFLTFDEYMQSPTNGVINMNVSSQHPIIVCTSGKASAQLCDRLRSRLEERITANAEMIVIAPRKDLLRAYSDDENVRARLVNEHNIAMNRNGDVYPDAPREILVCTEHPAMKQLNEKEREKEVLLSILHEDAHLGGIDDEAQAETNAQDRLAYLIADRHWIF